MHPNFEPYMHSIDQNRHDVVHRSTIEGIMAETYSPAGRSEQSYIRLHRIEYQRLALIYIVFAIGSLYNLESAPNSPISSRYKALAETCLAKGDVMRNCSVAGVQALVSFQTQAIAYD